MCGGRKLSVSTRSPNQTSVDTTAAENVGTEFVVREFETRVESGAIEALAREVESVVRALRGALSDGDRLETLLRSPAGREVLAERDSVARSDPEPLTQRTVVEPLFDALSYPDRSPEAGDLSGERGQQADYAVSPAGYEGIDSNRLLVEVRMGAKRP